jgi:hypothetical protein
LLKQPGEVGLRVPVHHLVGGVSRRALREGAAKERAAALAGDQLGGVDEVGPHPLGDLGEVVKIPILPVAEAREVLLEVVREAPEGAALGELLPHVAAHRARGVIPRGCARSLARQGLAHGCLRPLGGHAKGVGEGVAGVSAEDLVGRLTADADLHLLRGEAGDGVHGDHRRADDGLVL